jgi:hypothetical protein
MLNRYSLVIVTALFLGAHTVSAFEAVLETVPTQYEVITIQNPETEQLILGELDDAPEMFEIVSETPFTLTAEIRAVPDNSSGAQPLFNGILIRQKEIRGVEEIARLNAVESTWTVVTDTATGLKYHAGPYFSEQVEAGTYRIEISSPNNQGKYMLLVGTNTDENGFMASLSDVKTVYQFYGLSTVRMFSSPYVHYPVGILLLIGLIAGTWYWQRTQKHHA